MVAACYHALIMLGLGLHVLMPQLALHSMGDSFCVPFAAWFQGWDSFEVGLHV